MVALSSEFGGFQIAAKKTADALATQDAVRSVAESVTATRPDAGEWQHVVIMSQLEIARIKGVQHEPEGQRAAVQDAVSRAEHVAALPRKPEGWRADLMEASKQRGAYELAANAPGDAIADFRTALSLADELIAAEPDNKRWPAARAELVAQLSHAGEAAGTAGTPVP